MAENRVVVIPDSPEGIPDDKIHEEIDDVADKMIERWKAMQIRMVRAAKLQPDA